MSVEISKLNNAIVIICGIVLFILVILFFFVVLYRKRHNFFLKEKELMETRYAQILLQAQLEIQENVLSHISGEIHDNISQILSLARLNINTLDLNNAQDKLAFTDELLGRALRDLRGLSHALNTSYIMEAGLIASVKKLLESMGKTGQFATRFECSIEEVELDDKKLIILYRIIQEMMNNIVKHAEATQVDIRITKSGTATEIHVQDNGKGFNIEEQHARGTGMGITNMIQRASLIPAVIEISSVINQGTVFTITL